MPNERAPKRYELWFSETACSHSFFCSEHSDHHRAQNERDARLIWTVDAISYADARRKLNEYMGWEPYEPPPECAQYLEENY